MESARRLVNWARRHPLAVDAALALGILAVSLVNVVGAEVTDGQREMDALGWGLIQLGAIAVVFRRQAPVRVMWLAVGAATLFWVLDYPDDGGPNGVFLVVALYSVAAHVDRPRSVRHGAAAIGLVMVVVTVGVLVPEEQDLTWLAIPTNAVVVATAWVLGDSLRTRRAYLRELEHRVSETAARRDVLMRHNALEERSRIARELHDVIAHSLSVMVVQAGAARRVLADQPDRADEALGVIEATGRESLAEMRRIVGVLRSDGDHPLLGPAPTIDAVPELVRSFVEAGLPVELDIDGTARPLGPGLELSAYRVVQESLTNVLRHAGKASAKVTLRYRPHLIEVEVRDDGRGAAADAPSVDEPGNGLVGMRERVEAFGGSLHAGPATGGGFRVLATMPAAVVLDEAGRA